MSALRFVFPIASLVAFSLSAASPAQVEPRVLGLVDDAARVRIARDQHPLAGAVEDEGAVEDSLPTGRMLLLLKRSDVQESQLRDFIQAAHTPGSPSYHKWLTPEEFGHAFGPAESDLEAAKAWLQSHGLIVNRVRAGHMAIEFSGTAGQLRGRSRQSSLAFCRRPTSIRNLRSR